MGGEEVTKGGKLSARIGGNEGLFIRIRTALEFLPRDVLFSTVSTLFIVEGDSAAGSLTATRDVQTQAVFALKGKPLNTYGLTKKVIYENEEFHLLQAALNIEDGLDGLRYNRIVIATDADVDGMHIRLLLLSFFLQFFPDVIRKTTRLSARLIVLLTSYTISQN